MRRVETVRAGEFDLVGTCHEPDDNGPEKPRGIGFLFFNAGHVPREGHAGMIARIGDELANLGFPVFRFDLPGLGDSQGDLPVGLDDFFQIVHDGAYSEPAVALAKEVIARNGLSGLVLGGLCGGAATALFVADEAPEIVAGLVELEAEFLKPGSEDPEKLSSKLTSRASWLRLLTGHSRYRIGKLLPRGLLLRLFGRRLLPKRTNMRLVNIWQRIVEVELPVMVIMAGGRVRETFYDEVKQVLFGKADCPSVTVLSVPHTNHIFTTGNAPRLILRGVTDWATNHFARQ
ncbi:MAG: hypothetical protein GXP54_08370 [Deltaproteobacteria bacterium]|nr:hypothetical protein [Deltaproteobacteria bacterium]